MNSLNSLKYNKWIRVAVFNFMITATMGLLLRAAFVWEISWLDYRKMLHGHSHIAMLGWIYLALYALIVHAFVPKEKQESPFYNRLFWITQFSVVGMMISFPIQGYDTFSIIFSTAHLLLSYVFGIKVWRDTKPLNSFSIKLLRISIVTLFISSIGLWAMPIIMNTAASQTAWYYIAVQFYLHFQFNGWFILALIALIFKYLIEDKQLKIEVKDYQLFLAFYLPALLFTFFHVLTWAYGRSFSYIINGVGVVFQLIAILILFKYILATAFKNTKGKNWRLLIVFAFLSLIFKTVIQVVLVIPEWARISTEIRNFMIGYIHLINLGILSSGLFYLLRNQLRVLDFKWEMGLFLFGVFATEIYLFLQGYYYWQALGRLTNYHFVLFLLSIPMLLGIVIVFFRNLSDKKVLNNL